MKLTNELIDAILLKRVDACTKEELQAIFKLLGMNIKDFSSSINGSTGSVSMCFEIHHRIYFIIEIEAFSSEKCIGYNNPWLMEMGYSIPTENVATLMLVVLNMLLPRMANRIVYEGPQYNEREDYEYKTVDEMQALLTHMQDKLVEMTGGVKADKIQLDVLSVEQIISTMVGEITPKKMMILLDAVNDLSEVKYTGIDMADGSLVGKKGNVIAYGDLLAKEVKVGNIKI